MLRFLRLTAVISTTLTLVLPEIALTQPQSVISQFPAVPNPDTDMLLCYMQTEDGQVLNLDSLCKKPMSNSEGGSQTTYSNSSLNASNSVAGKPCYVVDSDGRPCPTSQSQ